MIYTRQGDKGKTSVFGGRRLSKSNQLIEVVGNLDELSSFIGLVINKIKDKKGENILIEIQRDIYKISAKLSGANNPIIWVKDRVKQFEQDIDNITVKLPKLNRFLIAPNTEISAWFHILRAVTRRAERSVVRLSKEGKDKRREYLYVVKYLNRLSDYFFTLARLYSKKGKEITV